MNKWVGLTGWGLFALLAAFFSWIIWQMGKAMDDAFGW